MSKRLRLLIVDESRATRQELAALASSEPYIDLIGVAKHGLEAMTLAGRHRPHVVLLTQDLPGLPGLEVARRLKEALPETRIFFLAADSQEQEAALGAGADATFVKGADTIRLLQALREAHSPTAKKGRRPRLPRRKKAAPKIVPWL
ncbi:MAG: response regulator transcription factor, partial [Anaerolineales bacterium]